MNFQCPTCNIVLQAEPEFAGKAVKCPSCNTKIDIPADFGQAPDASLEPEQSNTPTHSRPELNLNYKSGDHPATTNIWMGLVFGLAIGGLLYLVLFLLPNKESWIVQFFTKRGFPQYSSVLLFTWCLGVLILKTLNIQKQRRAMLIQALPQTISNDVTVNNVKEFHDNLINYPPKIRDSYLGNRIRKALETFHVRQNNSDVSDTVNALSDVDANKVAGSYDIVKVFLWAIPIMGFIGTVLGIGNAIGGFGGVLSGGDADISVGLKPILADMGLAFDTTLLALVLSIILAFPASALQSKEEDIITDVDLYCAENLMSRLNDGAAGKAQFEGDADLLRAVGEAMAENQKDVMDKFQSVQSSMTENLDKQTQNYEQVAVAIDKQMEGISKRTELYENKIEHDINNQIKSLSEGIQNLNTVLRDLNGKQVVVKKKWFGK